MGLKIVCHQCNQLLYEGFDLIPFFKLRDKIDGKCPNCKRKLAIRPITVELHITKGDNTNGKQNHKLLKQTVAQQPKNNQF